MDKFSWIKDLVAADRQMQEGMVDLNPDDDLAMKLEDASVDFLQDLKLEFLKVTSAYNQLSGATIGPVRVFVIAKTRVDFMLFRNGTKLVFSLQNGGGIVISYQMGITTGEDRVFSKHVLIPEMETFGLLKWTYKGHVVEKDYLIRFYMCQFVRSSAQMKSAPGEAL